MDNLKGKTAVITGGGGVICSGFAKLLAENGVKTAILDLSYENALEVAGEINSSGGQALAVKTDVLNRNDLEKAREKVEKEFGGCDILINGAGGNHPKGTTSKEYFESGDIPDKETVSFFDLDEEGVKFVMDLNFMGTLIPTQVFAKDMAQGGKGAIINISSMNAFKPLTKIPAYSAAKSAVSNFTQWLAVHFASSGIRVNAIAPGFFVTKQNYRLLFDEKDKPTPRAKKILDHTPMGRFGDIKDLNGALLWLANEEASGFVTGIIIPVDGGFSAYSGV